MSKQTTKEEVLQYIYDYGTDKAAQLLRLTPEQLQKIIEPEPVTVYLHKYNSKDLPINNAVADIIARNYVKLRTAFVKNSTNLHLSQTEEDIFHTALIKVMEEAEVVEDKILEHIVSRLNMVRYQIIMDDKQLKKVVSNALSE